MATIKNRLSELVAAYTRRTGLDLTHEDLARIADVSHVTIGKWMRNETSTYRVESLKRLMIYFNVESFDEFFVWEDDTEGNTRPQQHATFIAAM